MVYDSILGNQLGRMAQPQLNGDVMTYGWQDRLMTSSSVISCWRTGQRRQSGLSKLLWTLRMR
jgi:hypothetical protein